MERLEASRRLILRTAHWCLAGMAACMALSWYLESLGLGRHPHQPYLLYSTLGLNPMISAGFLGVIVCYWALEPPELELKLVLLAGFALEAYIFINRPWTWDFSWRLHATGLGLGLAGLAGILYRLVRTWRDNRWPALGILSLALFMPMIPQNSGWAYIIVEKTPLVYDQFAYQIESLPGFTPTLAVQEYVAERPALQRLAETVYNNLPVVMVLGVALNYRVGRFYNNAQLAYFGLGLAGLWIYSLYPAVGLKNAFSAVGVLPPRLGPVQLMPAPPELPRNCMPSLHLSSALAACWGCRFSLPRRLRFLAWLFPLLTIFAAMICSDHYLIDMVAAFPFTLLFQALTTRESSNNRRIRLLSLGFGGLGSLIYLAGLRWGHALLMSQPFLTVTGELTLVVVSILLERRLAHLSLIA